MRRSVLELGARCRTGGRGDEPRTGVDCTNSLLAWTPNTDRVAVIPWPDRTDFSRKYMMTALACWDHVRAMTFERRKTLVFIEAVHLIVRDRVPADAVHRALLALDEYRDGLAPDVPRNTP